MSNLIDRDKAIEAIEAKEANEYGNYREYNTAFNDGLRSAVFALEELPSAESVRRETYEQVRWERDTALEQLKELGYSLGEKPRKSDLISRQDAIEALTESNLKRHMDSVKGGQENRSAIRIIMGLPSAERTDISEILQYLDEKLHPIVSPEQWNVYSELHDMISTLSAERVGKWVERHPMRYDGKFVGADTDMIPDTRIRHLYCGECDKQMPIFEKFPYCPYCGARMVSEDDT